MENSPRRKPSRRTCLPDGVSSAVTLTIGLPAFAMTKAFPFAASSTSRDNWVFALWMFAVVMCPRKLSLVSLVHQGGLRQGRCPAGPDAAGQQRYSVA